MSLEKNDNLVPQWQASHAKFAANKVIPLTQKKKKEEKKCIPKRHCKGVVKILIAFLP